MSSPKRSALCDHLEKPLFLATREFRINPYPILHALQQGSRVTTIEANGFRMWIVLHYQDAKRILTDRSLMKDLVEHRKSVTPQCLVNSERRARVPHAIRRGALDRDGHAHLRLRRLIANAFPSRHMSEYRQEFLNITLRQLESLNGRSQVELVTEFARPVCMKLMSRILGVPLADALVFPQWENDMLSGASIDEVEYGGQQCYQFGLRMIELKRTAPGNDLFSRLLRAHDVENDLDRDELISMIVLLMIGAGEAANAIANGLLLLLANPGKMCALNSQSISVDELTEEVLRFESPFRLLPPRFSHAPITIGDCTIPSGELIAVSAAAVNRDPTIFPHPQQFEPTAVSKKHLSFGHGAHRCPGSQIARMQIQVALAQFSRCCSHFRLTEPGAPASWRSGDFMRRLDKIDAIAH